MKPLILERPSGEITNEELKSLTLQSAAGSQARRVLLIPPDITRVHSRAGVITAALYEHYTQAGAQVDVLPALGTHTPMTAEECRVMFGGVIPFDKLIEHRWREDVVNIGTVPGSYVSSVSDGLLDFDVEVQLSRHVVRGGYDLIVCAGQVVPHEVAGLASYSKHLFVGCGGSQMINRTHFIGAVYGAERIMGRADTPVRRVFDYAQEHFAAHLPVVFCLTVLSEGKLRGLYIGRDRTPYEQAAKLCIEQNIKYVEEQHTCLVWLDPEEYRSTWLGNKAVYRTRMMLCDGARLIVLAPGLRAFGEDAANDALIRKYGYKGRDNTLKAVQENADLADNLSTAAHLVHGSSDGRFTITYCAPRAMAEQVKAVGYEYMDVEEAMAYWAPATLKEGVNSTARGDVFYIGNPALGLWATKSRFTGA